jgi:hypothetical protein
LNDLRETELFVKTFEDQDEFIEAVLSGKYKNLMYAGHIRSGKTIAILLILVLLCKVFPGSRWCVVRESLPKLKKTTIPTFFKYCCPPNFVKHYNKSELVFTAKNNSQILFMSQNFEADPELTSFWGLEVNGFFLNQSDELQKEMFDMSIMRRGQWKIDPMPPSLTLLDANPCANWSKTNFYDPYMSGELPSDFFFKPADMNKNPHITEDYKRDLKKTLPVELFERFCNNNWDVVDAILQLTPWADIRNCKPPLNTPDKEKYLGVDVGRDGPDPSVWWMMEGDNFSKVWRKPQTKVNEVVDFTKDIITKERIDPQNVCVDGVGIGGGVVDYLRNEDYEVIDFIGGGSCDEEIPETNIIFANQRSYSNWLLSQEIRNRKIGNLSDNKLISDTGAIKYEIKQDKKLYILSKEEFKKKYKRSPDDWDAATYANRARMKETFEPTPGGIAV